LYLQSEKGVIFQVLDLSQDYLENSASSPLISAVLASISEFETAKISNILPAFQKIFQTDALLKYYTKKENLQENSV
jgi:rhamnogalacturonyl hydrolase YesR